MDLGIGAVLNRHGIDAERGFLPNEDPLCQFPIDDHDPEHAAYLEEIDELGDSLVQRLESGTARPAIRSLEVPPDGLFSVLTHRETVRLCQLAGFFASGYVHEIGSPPVDHVPAGAAVPLVRTSTTLGRKPILSYDVLCLHNFKRHDPERGLEVENLRAIQRFSQTDDEDWFVAIHVAIEAAAGDALVACRDAQRGVVLEDDDAVETALRCISDSLERQTAIMERMTDGNDPTAFVSRFRPYYEGFEAVNFEGTPALTGRHTFRGGSGAQSSALPSIDAALGIDHAQTVLWEKLEDMRSYMPTAHREVIAAFEDGPDVGSYVAKRDAPDLRRVYNRCLDGLCAFREVHFMQVAQYIREMTGDRTGTGGTDFMSFLPKMKRETEAQKR